LFVCIVVSLYAYRLLTLGIRLLMWRSCGNLTTQILGEKYILTHVCD